MPKHVTDIALNATSEDVIGGADHFITGNTGNNKFKALPASRALALTGPGITINGVAVTGIQGTTPNGVADHANGSLAICSNGTLWQRTSTATANQGWVQVGVGGAALKFGLEDNADIADRAYTAPDSAFDFKIGTFAVGNRLPGASTLISKIGALVAPQTLGIQVAESLGINVIRTGTILSATTPSKQYQDISNYGHEAAISINYYPTDGTHGFATDLTAYNTALTNYVEEISGYSVVLFAIENEENNAGYRTLTSGSAAAYIALLTQACNTIHDASSAYKVTNGGLTGPNFKFVIHQYLVENGRTTEASAFLAGEFTSSQQTTITNGNWESNSQNALICTFIRAVLDAMAGTESDPVPVDYVNFHWYSSTNGTTPSLPNTANLLVAKQVLEEWTGRVAITNELGQYNNVDAYPANMIAALASVNTPYVIWFSGDDSGGDGAVGLHDPTTGVLRSNGVSFQSKMTELTTSGLEDKQIISIQNGELYLPQKASVTPRMVTVGADGIIGSIVIPDVALPYSVYSFEFSQQGTADPEITVKLNTIGATVNWSRIAEGIYQGVMDAGFYNIDKTVFVYSNSIYHFRTDAEAPQLDYMTLYRGNTLTGPFSDTFRLETFTSEGYADGITDNDGFGYILKLFIEIRIYG